MRICSNCGATNDVEGSPICRKCGALLPVASRKKRIRIPTGNKEEKEKPKVEPSKQKQSTQEKTKKEKKKEEKVQFSAPEENKKQKQKKKMNLQDIPMEKKKSKVKKVSKIPQMPKIELPTLRPLPSTAAETNKRNLSAKGGDFMQEITPKPFQGSFISSKETPEKSAINALQSIPSPVISEETHATIAKQKRLEEDMVEVLGFLSKKLDLPKKEEIKPKPKAKKEISIPPSSMGEILKQLLSLDLHIEAAAIIKRDGEIIASALSSRMSDSLFATIGQNLSMIGTDIIRGLSAGDLKSISVKGTNGVLDLAPIVDQESSLVKDMILIIFSHPKVKSGIIAFAVNIIRKQIIDYLGKAKV